MSLTAYDKLYALIIKGIREDYELGIVEMKKDIEVLVDHVEILQQEVKELQNEVQALSGKISGS